MTNWRVAAALAAGGAMVLAARQVRSDSLVAGPPAQSVVICPNAWTSSLQSYVTARTAQGVTSRVFGVESVYAHYAGEPLRERLLAFVTEAHAAWSNRYLLLVGELEHVPSGPPSPSPEHDNYYALLEGPADMTLDLCVGRMPATSALDVAGIAAKWAAYDTRGWGRRELCLDGDGGVARSSKNDFARYGWAVREIYGGDVFHALQPQDVKDAVSGGYGLVNWAGHGAPATWQINHESAATNFYYRNSDACATTNGARLSFVNALYSCNTGAFSNRFSIARDFILAPAGGAIGYIGANTVVELPGATDAFLDRFYDRMLSQYLHTGHAMPGVAFAEAMNPVPSLRTRFNLLGDPAARMDLRPAVPDVERPAIAGVALLNNWIQPGEPARIRVLATDNDCVGVVAASVTRPDAGTVARELVYDPALLRHEYVLMGDDTRQPGIYAIDILARDISQNATNRACPNLEVLPDVEPPAILSLAVTPPEAYQRQTVAIEATVYDNNPWGPVETWAEVTRPDSTVVVVGSADFARFEDTGQTGVYAVVVQARDFSGNRAAAASTNFVIREDAEAPRILGAWVSTQDCHAANITTSAYFRAGAEVYFFVTATDNTAVVNLGTWMNVTWPDATVSRHDLWWCGMSWPEAYHGAYWDFAHPGTYSVRFHVRDLVGRTSCAGPVVFHVGTPTPRITEFALLATNVQLRCTGTNPWLPTVWTTTNLLDAGSWSAVTGRAVCRYTNGLYTVVLPRDPAGDRRFYRVTAATNAP